ncbi:MAG: nitrogenase molybdenum-iron protein alpha chain, partial [Puniceicoccaceae bacterium]
MNEDTNSTPSPMGPHGPTAAEAREKMLEPYPKKTLRKRGKQILVNEDPGTPAEIGANSRTVPGIITQRGCSYAGCKGVVIGPIYDVLHITHGPIGCGWY